MKKELRKVEKWLTTNRPALNVDKSHLFFFISLQTFLTENKDQNKKQKDYRRKSCQVLGSLARLHSELETSHN